MTVGELEKLLKDIKDKNMQIYVIDPEYWDVAIAANNLSIKQTWLQNKNNVHLEITTVST
jgi:hypothetical protein